MHTFIIRIRKLSERIKMLIKRQRCEVKHEYEYEEEGDENK